MIHVLAPWYIYTGPSNKDHTYKKLGSTWLDEIARIHDQEVANSTIVGSFGKKVDSEQTIKADVNFIKNVIFTLPNILHVNKVKAMELNDNLKWLPYSGKFIVITIVDLIYALLGSLLFSLNIFLNRLNLRF